MHISNNKFRLAELKREHVEESALLLGKMFFEFNKTWKSLGPTEAEIINFMNQKTHEILDWQE